MHKITLFHQQQGAQTGAGGWAHWPPHFNHCCGRKFVGVRRHLWLVEPVLKIHTQIYPFSSNLDSSSPLSKNWGQYTVGSEPQNWGLVPMLIESMWLTVTGLSRGQCVNSQSTSGKLHLRPDPFFFQCNVNFVCRISRRDRRLNLDTLKELNAEKDTVDVVKMRRLAYFGHVTYMKSNRLRGKLNKKWMDNIRKDCATMNTTTWWSFSACHGQDKLEKYFSQSGLRLTERRDIVTVAKSLNQTNQCQPCSYRSEIHFKHSPRKQTLNKHVH